jgi:hypothetical protein
VIGRVPVRRRAQLPPGHWWLAFAESSRPGARLVIVISDRVSAGSRLERRLTRQAMRAWYLRRARGLLAPPIAAIGGISWLARYAHRPSVAGGMAVTMTGTAAVLAIALSPAATPDRRVPVAPPRQAPPGSSPAQPRHPAPSAPDRGAGPLVPVPVSTRALPVRLRHTLHRRITLPSPVTVPPVVTDPPVRVPPVIQPATSSCRVVLLQAGRLVRICV